MSACDEARAEGAKVAVNSLCDRIPGLREQIIDLAIDDHRAALADARRGKSALTVGEKVKFHGEKQAYTVQAVCTHGRFAACTKPFNLKHTVLYTVVDMETRQRGVDNSLGNSLGYETVADCQEAVDLFCSGQFEFSHRRMPIPLHFEIATDDDRETCETCGGSGVVWAPAGAKGNLSRTSDAEVPCETCGGDGWCV